MITSISGTLEEMTDEGAIIRVAPFGYQVLLPDFARRQLQIRIGEDISLFTIHYFEGNPAQGGRMTPRLVGFLSEIEREFFELFCSVDGVGAKKALRAMVRPVQEVATLIENQNTDGLSALPGIGPATADRVIAKLRRKMPKFALMVKRETQVADGSVEPDIMEETYQLLCKLGHNEQEAQRMLEAVTAESKKKFKDVETLLNAVYQQHH